MFPPPNVALGALSPATFCKLADELDNISGAVNSVSTGNPVDRSRAAAELINATGSFGFTPPNSQPDDLLC